MVGRLFLSLAAVLLLGSQVASASAPPGPDPEAVAEVLAGKRTEANAAWWGFDPEDSTEYLQAAINSGASRVIIPNMGQDWVVRPIFLRSNLELVFEPGVVVTAKKGEYHGTNDSVFTARDVENLVLRGYGATIRMHKEDYMSPAYRKAEWRMALNIRSSKNVQILGLTLKSTGGDGIYLGRGSTPYNENIVIRDVIADDNYRQGISVITVKGLLIENSVFKNTGGTPPMAGIDFEPNNPDEKLEDIVIRNTVFENNEGAGILLAPQNLRSDARISILMENILVRGNSYGVYISGGRTDNYPGGEVIIRNCIIEYSQNNGIRVIKEGDELKVTFENCVLHNVATGASTDLRVSAPVYLSAASSMGGVTFNNVAVFDEVERPVIYTARSGQAAEPFAVQGRLDVVNPFGVSARWDAPVAEGGLTVAAVDAITVPYDRVVSLSDYLAPPLQARLRPIIRFRSPVPRLPVPLIAGSRSVLRPEIELLHVDESAIQRVEIMLDGQQIFAGPALPAAGEIAIDTAALQEGEHELSVVVETAAGRVEGAAPFDVYVLRRLADSTEPLPPPGAPTRLRNRALLLIEVAEDESLHVHLQQRQVGRYPDTTTYVITGPDGKEVARGELGIGEGVMIDEPVPPGVYTLQLNTGLSAVEPEVFNRRFVIRATQEEPLGIISRARPLWFYVPEGTESFSIHMAVQGPAETALVRVINPAGQVVLDKVLVQPETLTFSENVEPGAWHFTLERAPTGYFEDVNQIYFSGPVPPYLSDRADRLLVPASVLP